MSSGAKTAVCLLERRTSSEIDPAQLLRIAVKLYLAPSPISLPAEGAELVGTELAAECVSARICG